MARSEEELRKEAVRRRLTGESPERIACSLGRSRRWVAKWIGRYDPAAADWAAGAKRGPERAPHRTAAETEALVLAVRERLVANPWAQVGAEAIAWELRKLGVEPPPRRTISGASSPGRAPPGAGAAARADSRRASPTLPWR